MGTYLTVGIVQNIAVDKRRIKYPDITVEHITRRLNDELNLDYYNYSEDNDGYYWEIKPQTLEGNLVDFLDAQFQMYTSKKHSNMQEVIEKLTKTKNGEEIIKLAADEHFVNFQLVEQIIEYVEVIRDNGFSEHICLCYSLISYFMDGKIIMEGYGGMFRYFEHNIRLQREKYPLADCIKVMITS
ncbi:MULTISPECIES: hypothetical protein [Rickettsieae]|uniref:hypothetical protein n=1 Tax=Rickettsieae TaxID=33988 RepID=UPI000B9AD863|nr:hypothetical protein [Rickettsia endosymbiont of Culicoides newsteadi]MCC8399822.1 hypothetical protein [Rickettsia endosymbiont of Platyusa sonomae]OZG32034.1 hypothetical protein RiCNE_05660 [Rickettsia endosymbiont of Culicoides newsteadi]HJD57016.1 hypothetical protein [Rickettsia endosymbiont of Sericostoma sp. HW-2014]